MTLCRGVSMIKGKVGWMGSSKASYATVNCIYLAQSKVRSHVLVWAFMKLVTMALDRPSSYYWDTNIINFVLLELQLWFLVKSVLVLDANNKLVALKFSKGYAHFTVA